MSETKDVRVKLTVYHSASCNGRKLATIHGIDEAASALSPGEYQLVLAALEQAPKPAGGEWVMVPRKPTKEMCGAFWEAHEEYEDGGLDGPDHQWAAMLAAAPPSPAASPSSGEVVAWAVKGYADGWIVSQSEASARALAKNMGNTAYPLRITSPEAPQASEVVRAADDRYPSVFYAHDRSNRISVGHYNTASGWSPHIHVETSLENRPGARWVQVSLTPDEAEQFALHILNKVSHARTALAKIGGANHDK